MSRVRRSDVDGKKSNAATIASQLGFGDMDILGETMENVRELG